MYTTGSQYNWNYTKTGSHLLSSLIYGVVSLNPLDPSHHPKYLSVQSKLTYSFILTNIKNSADNYIKKVKRLKGYLVKRILSYYHYHYHYHNRYHYHYHCHTTTIVYYHYNSHSHCYYHYHYHYH